MLLSIWKKNPRLNLEYIGILVLTIIFGLIYWHDSTQGTYQLIDYRQGTYFKVLALQFEKGQLGTNDMIGGDWLRYNGHFYLYFAPLPALFWLLLKHIGIVTSFTALTLLLSIINLFLFFLLIRSISAQLKIDEKKGVLFRFIAFILYGFGPLYFLSSRYFIYETAIVFGSTFLLSAVLVFFIYWTGKVKTLLKQSLVLFGCGILMGLVFLSRLNLVLMVFPIIGFIIWKETMPKKVPVELKLLKSWWLVSLIAIPVLISAWGITLYNTARFGNPTEFGIRYSIIGTDHGDVAERVRSNKMTSPSFLALNTIQLIILRPFWSSMPAHISYNNRPSWLIGPYPRLADDEYVSSLFFSSPLLLFILYLFITFKKHKPAQSTIIFLVVSLIASYIYAASSMAYARRYIQDYYPFAILLTYAGMQFFWQDLMVKKKKMIQYLTISAISLGIIVTVAISINLNCQVAFMQDFQRCFKIWNPIDSFKPLAKGIVTDLLAHR